MIRRPALLVAHKNVFVASGGGVQLCNRDYMTLLEAAGFDLRTVSYEYSNHLKDLLTRRLFPGLANVPELGNLLDDISKAVEETPAEFIFFGVNLNSTLSMRLKKISPGVKQVFLSHGTEVIDFCIDQQFRRVTKTENRIRVVAERMAGQSLFDEIERRRWIDAVLTLSPFEAEIERWLGVRKVLWVPRIVTEPPLDARPLDQRVGCVSTLDHPPNFMGLVELFEPLAKIVSADFRFRLVGQPARMGRDLANRFQFVEYLGPLSDRELRSEAASWCCFVHPIFVYAKGCSTKLAMALGWGLPLATTAFGTRGYVWNEDLIPLAQTPSELATFVAERGAIAHFEAFRKKTKAVVDITPSVQATAAVVRAFL